MCVCGLSISESCARVCVCVSVQVVMMLFLSLMAYLPFRKLLLVLEDRGFADPHEHPTICRVRAQMTFPHPHEGNAPQTHIIRSECWQPQGRDSQTFCADFNAQVFQVYVIDATRNTIRDLQSRPLTESFYTYTSLVSWRFKRPYHEASTRRWCLLQSHVLVTCSSAHNEGPPASWEAPQGPSAPP